MDPTVLAALVGAATTIIGIILTAVLTHTFTLSAERERILLEREERRKQEEEAKKKVEVGTWEDVATTVRARAESEGQFVVRLPVIRLTCLLVALPMLVFLIVIAILLRLGPDIVEALARFLTRIQ